MELRQLRAFVAVATDGHFGRAAAKLNLTQPGLTLRIQALEKELGVQLLERSAREVQLTAAGTVLLPHARSLLRIEDRALRELRDQADGVVGRLRISYVAYGAVAFPAEVVAEFRRRFPMIHVETTVGNSAANAEYLRNGSVDAAFIYPGYIGAGGSVPDGMAVRLLRRDTVLLALSPNHPLARFEEIPVTALRREPLIMFPTSPGPTATRSMVRVLSRLMGGEPNIVAYEPPDQALEAVAHSTSLVSFANGSRAVSSPVPGIAYRRISPAMYLDFGVAHFRDDDSPLLADLLRVIDEMAKDEPGDLPEGSELLTA
jgi:LysR family transcriptional regulator, benzoate and cis,cis-muconate-responsive activator of ben and cat genes